MSCGCSGTASGGGTAAPGTPPKPRDILVCVAALVALWAIMTGEWKALLFVGAGVAAYRHLRTQPATSTPPAATSTNSPPDSTGLYGSNASGVASETTTVLGISQTLTGDC